MFKTSKEKHAYKVGIKKGRAGGKVWDPSPIYKDSRKKTKSASSFHKEKHSRSGKTATFSRSDKEWDDFFNASVKKSYSKRNHRDDFERDSKGRIKGSYTADGFFEPD